MSEPTGAEVWRDYVLSGVPSSGVNAPKKSDIRRWATSVERQIVGAAAGLKSAKTWAELSAVSGSSALQKGEVTDDAGTHTDPVVGGTVPNKGSYSWSTSPAGWTRTGDLIDTDALQAEIGSVQIVTDSLEAAYGASKPDRVAQVAERFSRSGFSAVNYGVNGRIVEALRDRDQMKILGANGVATNHVERRDFDRGQFARSNFQQAEFGEGFQISSGVDRDGNVFVGGRRVALADDYIVYVEAVGGYDHIFSETTTGKRLKLSSDNFDNSSPQMTGDGCCIWMSDRGDGLKLYWSLLDKADEAPVLPRQFISCYGDSLTYSNYAATMRSVLGIPVHNFGISGSTSRAILSRMRPTPMVVAGNQIPASGPVNVSCLDGLGPAELYGGSSVSINGLLAGVAGVLAWNQSTQSLTFTRAAAGAVVAVPAGTPFVWIATDQITGTEVADPLGGMAILFAGRNDFNPERTFANLREMVAALPTYAKRFLIPVYLPKVSEVYGTKDWDDRYRLLQMIHREWPQNHFDLLPLFLANGNGSPGDNAAIANKVPPPSLMSDDVHPNSAGVELQANAYAQFFISKGWIN